MFSRIPDGQDYTNTRSATLPGTEDVAELSLLLPSWQVSALEAAAHTKGLTTAAMMRRMIEDFFGRTQSARQLA